MSGGVGGSRGEIPVTRPDHNAIPFTCFCRARSQSAPFLIFPLVPDCSGSDPIISNAFGFFRREKAGVFLVEIKKKRDAFGFGFDMRFAADGIHSPSYGMQIHRFFGLET